MAVAGSLTYDTKIDKNGFEKDLNSMKGTVNTVGGQIKSIVSALGIDKLISKAISVINESLDGAITRLDTLNNYPKVMSNLGISGEEAEKSIKKMSDKLAGLPTTLNQGALAVQRFTSANSNIEKSTDYFLALNNALLAGGASADIQATALEQLSQSYAKGKPDMMEWRSAMTAMPAQLKQVANAMGYISTDKLGEDLREGKVSMDKFMEAIVRLNEEGIDGFQSFEKQARNSTGGIATSITVAKTQVVKGVADIVQALDDELKRQGLGGISEIISNIGKKAKEVLDYVANHLPQIIEFLKKIAPIVLTIVGAIKTYQIATQIAGIIKIAEKVWSAVSAFLKLIPAIKDTKDAFMLLGTVLKANPIGIVVTAIGLLATALTVLYKKNETFREGVKKTFGAIRETFEPLWNTLKESFKELWDTIRPLLEELWNTLKEAWNELQPSLSELWNAIKELFVALKPIEDLKLDLLIWSIKTNIESMKVLIPVITKALIVLIPIITQIIKFVIVGVTSLVEVITKAVNGTVKLFQEDIPNAWDTLKSKANEFKENIWNKLVDTWNNIVSFFTEGIPNFIQSVIEWFRELPSKIGYFIGFVLGKIIQFGIDVWNWVTVDLPQIIDKIVEWFKELPDRIWHWLLETVNKIVQWGEETYNKAVEWISETADKVVRYFKELPGRIWQWLIETINKVIEWGHNLKDKGKEQAEKTVENVQEEFNNLPGKMLEIGKNIVKGLWNGIKNTGSWINSKVKEFSQGILNGMKDSLGIHSPSTLFRDEIGKFIPQGVAVGIETDTDSAIKAIHSMNEEIITEMNKAVAFETGSINASASVKSNNSMLNVIKATFNIDGSVDIDGNRAGRYLAPSIAKTIKAGGLA